MSIRPITYKKVYVNSKYRTSNSRSISDFQIELRETFEIPDGTTMQVHELAIPNTWYSINENNRNLYFEHRVLPPATPTGTTYLRIEIPLGNYTPPELESTIQRELNFFFDVTGRENTYTVSYNTVSNKITIETNYTETIFIVLPDNLIANFVGSFSNTVDLNNLRSINNVLNTPQPQDFSTSVVPWVSGFINLLHHQDIYISCPELSNNNFHSPSTFSNAIVKKIPVNASFAGIINGPYGVTDYDFVNVSRRSIRRLTFRITDETGNLINFNGVNLSFSLLFHNTDAT